MNGRLTVLSGPSGVGKGSVIAAVRRRDPGVWLSVSVTTRAPRPGETEGVEFPDLPFGQVVSLIVRAEGASAFRDLLESGRCKQLRAADDRWGGYPGLIWSVAWSPDCRLLAVGGGRAGLGLIELWDVSDLTQKRGADEPGH